MSLRTPAFRLSREDDGAGLAELLVTMALAVLLITVSGALAIQLLRLTSKNDARNRSSAAAQIGMEHASRMIRSADDDTPAPGQSAPSAIWSAGPDEVVLQSFATSAGVTGQSATVLLRAEKVGGRGQLVQQRTLAGSPIPEQRVLMYDWLPCTDATGAAQPLFRYYDRSGAELVPSAGQPLAYAKAVQVTWVQIDLCAQASTAADPARVTTRVRLTNTLI